MIDLRLILNKIKNLSVIFQLTSPDFGATPRHSGRQLFGEDGLLRGQRWARPNGNNHHQRRRNGGPRRDQRGSPLISEDLKMAASKGNLDEVQNLLNRGKDLTQFYV